MRHLYLGLALTLLCAGGCVSRELVIVTDPPGAKVTVNRTYTGTSPMTLPFVHYETFGILIEKDGYHPLYVEEPIAPPLYERAGIDFFTEIAPVKKSDHRELHYTLQKSTESDNVNDVLSRASAMKENLAERTKAREEAEKARKPFQPPLLHVRESVQEREQQTQAAPDAAGDKEPAADSKAPVQPAPAETAVTDKPAAAQ